MTPFRFTSAADLDPGAVVITKGDRRAIVEEVQLSLDGPPSALARWADDSSRRRFRVEGTVAVVCPDPKAVIDELHKRLVGTGVEVLDDGTLAVDTESGTWAFGLGGPPEVK